MSLGVVRYCTPEGGSGFISNPALPWLSSFNIQQMSPVYNQTPGWLRESAPGSFTNYPRFGPPYSLDGGTLPPYAEEDFAGDPMPVDIGCGMGDLTLLRSDVVAPMPSITTTARSGCTSLVNTCPSAVEAWIEANPWLAAGLGLLGGWLLFGGKK